MNTFIHGKIRISETDDTLPDFRQAEYWLLGHGYSWKGLFNAEETPRASTLIIHTDGSIKYSGMDESSHDWESHGGTVYTLASFHDAMEKANSLASSIKDPDAFLEQLTKVNENSKGSPTMVDTEDGIIIMGTPVPLLHTSDLNSIPTEVLIKHLKERLCAKSIKMEF